MRSAVVLAIILLAAGCVERTAPAAPPAPPAPPEDAGGFVPNLFLLDGARPPGGSVHNGSEPMVLADRSGEWLWIGSTRDGGSRSRDNGTTWERMPSPFVAVADGWSLAQDEVGRLYATTTSIPYVEVYHSDDEGRTWRAPFLPIRPPASAIVDAAPVADRPWIAARGDGEAMLIFYDFGRTTSESCLRTTDGGQTWTDRDPMAGEPLAGRPDFDADGRFGFMGSRGLLHIFPTTPLASSRCLAEPQTVKMFSSQGDQTMLHTSAHGRVFYAAAPTSRNAAVELAASDGASVRRLIVSPPELKANTFATVSAGPDDVAVAWYGSETPGAWSTPGYKGSWNVYVARVRDLFGEPTVTVTRLTTEPNHVGDICTGGIGCTGASDRDLLDYFGIDHDIWGGVHVAYAHDGAGRDAEVRHAHLAP